MMNPSPVPARTSLIMYCLAMTLLVLGLACHGGSSSPPPPGPASAPTIQSLTPRLGAPGDAVTLTGTGLATTMEVRFGGAAVSQAQIQILSDTRIQVTVPADAVTGPITLRTQGGSAQAPAAFEVVRPQDPPQAPVVDRFAPLSGRPGTVVTLVGTHLTGVTQVAFGGVPAQAFTVESGTQITATVPPGAVTGEVTVASARGSALAGRFTVILQSSLDAFAPLAGTPGTAVTLTGTHLGGATRVTFAGTEAAFAQDSDTRITATVPAGAGSGPITVQTPYGTAVSANRFTVPEPPPAGLPAPVITDFAPRQGLPGAKVVLTGTGFTGATQVQFGEFSAASLTVVNDTQIVTTVPAAAASARLTVVAPGGVAQSAGTFLVVPLPPPAAPGTDTPPPPPPPAAPTLTDFAPRAALAGQVVTLTGTDLTTVTRVTFGGVAAAGFSVASNTTLLATVPAGAATGPIAVATPQGPATAPGVFTVLAAPAPDPAQAAPAVNDLAPAQGRPGETVVLTGTAFTGVSAVKFGFVPAQSFNLDSPTRITAVLPPLAATGPILVRTPRGQALSAPFTVLAPLPPAITRFDPPSGRPGTAVVLTGLRFTGLTQVAFGGVPSPSIYLDSDTRITALVPLGAATGVITVTTPNGLDTSATAFVVIAPPPAVTDFQPAQGDIGTPVIVTGTGFREDTQVFFNGVPAPNVIVSGPTELDVLVPIGATTGPVRVQNGPVSGVSRTPFTVQAAAPAQQVFVGGWYLTQATQDLNRSVPLVANRDGLLRVFLRANLPGGAAPSVRVSIIAPGGTPWQRTIAAAPGQQVPVVLQEGALASSWNLPIPGAVLQPGSTLQLELDPELAVPGADRSGNSAQLPLDIRVVPPLKVTLIPVTQGNGATGDLFLNGRTLQDWVRLFQAIFPIANAPGGLDVRVGAPFRSTQVLLEEDHGPWFLLQAELAARQISDGDLDRFYYGVVRIPDWGGTIGLTVTPEDNPIAVGTDSPARYQETFAHEMGHSLNRDHAPCGGVVGGLAAWPRDDQFGGRYSSARIGVFGFDVAAGLLKDPEVCTDIMAYCPNKWVSDWTYKGILDWRSRPAGPFAALRAPAEPARRCLQVGGHWQGGRLTLRPAFTTQARPALPSPGELTLELLGAGGEILARVPFGVHREEGGAFLFSLPLEDGAAPRGLRVRQGDAILATRQAADPGRPAREPHCAALRPGVAYLGWDRSVYPEVRVSDPRTGTLLGFGDGGALELRTDASALEVAFSDGVRSFSKVIPVQ